MDDSQDIATPVSAALPTAREVFEILVREHADMLAGAVAPARPDRETVPQRLFVDRARQRWMRTAGQRLLAEPHFLEHRLRHLDVHRLA